MSNATATTTTTNVVPIIIGGSIGGLAVAAVVVGVLWACVCMRSGRVRTKYVEKGTAEEYVLPTFGSEGDMPNTPPPDGEEQGDMQYDLGTKAREGRWGLSRWKVSLR